MKRKIKNILLATLLCALYVTPVHATEIGEETLELSNNATIEGECVQREERLIIEGYELPEVVDHNIGAFDENGLALLEKLSLCGKTSEFHLTLNNDMHSVIPYNYINMLYNNYTPFTLHIEDEGVVMAIIETNGVTAQSGNFPAHINLAQGVDFIQMSFDADLGEVTGTFRVTFNCMDFIGRSYDIYENGEVVNTGKIDSTGVMVLNLSNTDTKTIKFIQPQIVEPTEEHMQDSDSVPVDNTDVVTTQNNMNAWLIGAICGAGIIVCAVIIILLLKKKGSK